MAIDNSEVEKVLDEHRGILSEHGEKIQRLEIDAAVTKEQVKNIETQMIDMKTGFARLEHTVTTSMTSLMQMHSKMAEDMSKNATQIATIASNNATQIATTNSNNKAKVNLKLIGVISAVVTGLVTVSTIIVKAIWG